jgi:hypothetical protein
VGSRQAQAAGSLRTMPGWRNSGCRTAIADSDRLAGQAWTPARAKLPAVRPASRDEQPAVRGHRPRPRRWRQGRRERRRRSIWDIGRDRAPVRLAFRLGCPIPPPPRPGEPRFRLALRGETPSRPPPLACAGPRRQPSVRYRARLSVRLGSRDARASLRSAHRPPGPRGVATYATLGPRGADACAASAVGERRAQSCLT